MRPKDGREQRIQRNGDGSAGPEQNKKKVLIANLSIGPASCTSELIVKGRKSKKLYKFAETFPTYSLHAHDHTKCAVDCIYVSQLAIVL